MKILDYFEHPQFGVIVSTINPEFDNLPDEEIKKRIGNEIFILDADDYKKKSVTVKSIDIATSLIGKKNINICLSDSIKLSDINPRTSLILLSEADTTQLADTGV